MSRMLGRPRTGADVGQPPVRVRRDWVLAAGIAGTTLVEVAVRDDLPWRPVAVALGTALALTMLWRRTRPLAMVALGFGALAAADVASLIVAGAPVFLYAGASVLVLVYALFRWGSTRQAAAGLAIALAEWLVSTTTDAAGLVDAAAGLVVLLFPAAVGLTVRYRHIAETQALERARSQEREVLARELHDTVAHHVSGIAVQAQAGRFLAASRDLEGAARALDVIEGEASRTLTEMRAMVGSLRRGTGAPPLLAPLGVADIAGLATTDGEAGPRIDVEEVGDLERLRPPLEAALYRVAQESVTNARRHARLATRVLVTVTGEADAVRLSVTDDGEHTVPRPRRPGYGLVGMAERVALLGGTLEAGPRPDRGWTVQATLPRDAEAT